mgnify:CR=1 FL=1
MAASAIVNILIAYGACQALFIAYILLRSKNRSLFKTLFSILLVIEGITLFERLLVETEAIQSVPHLLGLSYPISFLKPPLMLFMTMAITVKDFRLTGKKYLHFIPFGLMLLSNTPFYFLSGGDKIEFVNTFMNRIPSYQSFDFYFSLSFFLYIGVYIFLSLHRMHGFRQQVSNNALVNWYRIVLITYSIFLMLHLGYFAIQPLGKFNFAMVNQVSMLSMTFIIQSIAFRLMDKSALLNTRPPDLGDLEKRKAQENLILEKLETDKIYLDEELSLKKFAESVALPQAKVSGIINQKFNCSFKKLVNQYRVNEARHLLQNADKTKVKLIDISFQAGFNNKVSFYRAFKEFENMSPSEYLEKLKNGENA